MFSCYFSQPFHQRVNAFLVFLCIGHGIVEILGTKCGLFLTVGKVKDDFFIIAELGVVDHGGIVLVTVVFLDSGEESFIDGHFHGLEDD